MEERTNTGLICLERSNNSPQSSVHLALGKRSKLQELLGSGKSKATSISEYKRMSKAVVFVQEGFYV